MHHETANHFLFRCERVLVTFFSSFPCCCCCCCRLVLLVRNRNGHSSDVIKQQFDSFFVLHLWIIKTFYTNSGQFTCNVFARNTLHTRACIGNTNSKCIAFLLAFPIWSLYIFGVWFEFRKFAYDLFMKWMANVCCASVLSPGKLKSTSKRQMSASMCQKRFYVIWKIMKTFLPLIQCMGCISSCTIDWISSLRQMNTLSVCTFFHFQCKNVCDKYTIVCIWLNSTNFLIEFIKNVVFFCLNLPIFVQWMSKCDLDFINHWNAWKMVSIENYCCGIWSPI